MKLYYTPRSHFSRKVRLLLDAWGVAFEAIDVGNVGLADTFGGNPLMKVPVLVDGAVQVLDSDHIAAYLTRTLDPDDRYAVLSTDVARLNTRAVMNGVMAAEVELILAERSGLGTTDEPRFDKLRRTMSDGLAWLEAQASSFGSEPSYLGFHLVALWDHVQLYASLPLQPYPTLRTVVDALSAHAFVRHSAPV